jgi:hypothetical protein
MKIENKVNDKKDDECWGPCEFDLSIYLSKKSKRDPHYKCPYYKEGECNEPK